LDHDPVMMRGHRNLRIKENLDSISKLVFDAKVSLHMKKVDQGVLNPAMRTTGIDILSALLDHDPVMMRGYMLKAVNEKRVLHRNLRIKENLDSISKLVFDAKVSLHMKKVDP
jgi:hypothetical protein